MKRFFSIGHKLPFGLSSKLFGNRKKHGITVKENDPEWKNWMELSKSFYEDTQREGLGEKICEPGYKILKHIDFKNKKVLEIGPGYVPHLKYIKEKPECYTILDTRKAAIDGSSKILKDSNISNNSVLIGNNNKILPFKENSFDIVILFYSLEHLPHIKDYLLEIKRILRQDGLLTGGIPTEGGIAWGIGRFFTTRRNVLKNHALDINDKIICWEHKNFADKILNELSKIFYLEKINFWPFKIRLIDPNLIISFIFRKKT